MPTNPLVQRSYGAGRLSVASAGSSGVTRLTDLRQEGCARLRLPRPPHGSTAPLEAISINTGGGLTGGDRLSWNVQVAENAAASVTSQACERMYRADAGEARIDVTLDVASGGMLLWWPQETIVFDGAAYARRIEANVHPDATLLIVEATLFGRAAMGERMRRGRIRDSWRIRRPDGPLVHAEELRISGEADLAGRAALGGAGAMASVLLVSPRAEAHLDAARSILDDAGGTSGAASCWGGRLLARITATDGYALRRSLVPLAAELAGRDVPRGWNF